MKALQLVGAALLAVAGIMVLVVIGTIGFALCLTIVLIPLGAPAIIGAWAIAALCFAPLIQLLRVKTHA
jgi:hypothetical protein